MVRDLGPVAGGREGTRQALPLAVGVLHDEAPTGAQQRGGGRGDAERDDEPVLAAAVERELRVVVGDLRVERDHPDGDVGRVAHDDVDPPGEIGELRDRRRVGRRVGGHECDGQAGRLDVAGGPGEGEVAHLDGGHLGGGRLVGDGEGQRPRPGAQVDDDGGLNPLHRGEHVVDGLLGLRSRHEDPRPDLQLQPAEGRGAGEVLQRHPRGSLVHETGQPRCRRVVQPGTEEEAPLDVGAVGPEDVPGEEDRVGACRGHAGSRQRGDRLVHHGTKGGHSPSPARAASRAASSASTAESMTASRSPSRTVSRWCAL